MADLNKVYLMGRLTFDPELRRTPAGMAVVDLRMATSRSWNNKDGDKKEETLYIDVTCWDRQAENCCKYLRKGSSIHVEGSLKMDTWEDKTTGEKRSKIKVTADRVQFLDKRSSETEYIPPEEPGNPAGHQLPPRGQAKNKPSSQPPAPPKYRKPEPDPEDEGEIPF